MNEVWDNGYKSGTYIFAVISVHIKILGTVYVPSLSVFTSYAPLLANFKTHT